jgi:hypothetical protein
MQATIRMTLVNTQDTPPATQTEEAAAQAMWQFYRVHKQRLITDIRDHRDTILSNLMAGVTPEDAFAPYARPSESNRQLRRAA